MKYLLASALLSVFIYVSVFPQANDSIKSESSFTMDKFDPDTAIEHYLNTISPEENAISDKYATGNNWQLLWSFLAEIVVAVIFLFFGLSKWMKKISLRVRNVNIQNLIYLIFYFIFSFIIVFPYEFYTGFVREHRFGLSNMSFGEWFGEELLGLLISVILVGLLLLVIYYTIRKAKDRWWIWAGGIGTLFIILVIYISPVLLAPLFNEYSELPSGPLKEEILSLARANGIPTDKVYQFDASKQSKRISANVSGIGNTIRISLNDNLLNRCNTEEIKAVMAHEMGHYVLNHVQSMILLFSLMFFLGFWLLHISFRWIWNKWGKQLNISGLSDIAGLPLIMVLLAFFILLSTPFVNNIVRSDEVEADIFGLNAAREPDGFASVAMMLSEYRKVSPARWEEVIFCDHPSPRSRVVMAMKWKAENLDKQPKSTEYVKE